MVYIILKIGLILIFKLTWILNLRNNPFICKTMNPIIHFFQTLVSGLFRSRLFGITYFLHLFLIMNAEIQAQQTGKIEVLIVDGFSNHDWQQTSAVTQWILEESGLFKVNISTVPEDSMARQSWLPSFDQYAVVIQNTNNIHNANLKWPSRAERALENYVKQGGGLYVLHSANNAFAHWEAYNEMIGLGWRSQSVGTALEIDAKGDLKRYLPGEGRGTGHGDRFNALIQILNRHPINQGYPDAWQTVNTEVYYFPRGDAKNIEVLSYAYDSTNTQKHWPVEWVVDFGKGKVYNSSLGHLWKGGNVPAGLPLCRISNHRGPGD